MPNWKKVIVSGSNAILSNITASGDISASGDIYATNFIGTSSLANVAVSSSALLIEINTNDVNYAVPFTNANNNYGSIYTDSKPHLTYNPSTNTLKVGGIIDLSGSIDFKINPSNNSDLIISGTNTLDIPVGGGGSLNILTSSLFEFYLANRAQNINIGTTAGSAVNLGANNSVTTVYNFTAAGSNIRATNLPSNTVNADSVVMWESSTGYFYYTASDALGGGNQNLQQVTEQGSSTTIPITASAYSGSYIDFDVIPDTNAPDHKEGRVYYNAEDGALTVYNNEADISLQVGQEFWIRVKNNSGDDILNGTPVRISGSQGDRPKIYPATAEDHTENVSFDNHIAGIATHDILDTEEGYITAQGIVRGIDTSNFAAGDILYLQTGSPANPEDYYRNTPPPFPYDIIQAGYVARSADPNGFIFAEPKEPTHFNNISGLSGSYNAHVGDLWVYQPNKAWTHTKNLSGSYTIEGGNLTVEGDIIAQQYIVNSTVTNVTMSFSSGSTIFGDSLDDTHLFTGSVDITGSLTASGNISASGDITGDDFNIKGNANITGIIDVLTDNDNLSYLTQTAFVRADNWDAERHIVLWRPDDSSWYTPVGMLGTGVEGTWNSNKGYRFYLTNQAGGAPSASQHLAILQNGDVEIDYKSSEQAYNLSGSAKLYVNGNISTTSHITASGNISASGYVSADSLILNVTSSLSGSENPYFISIPNGARHKEGVIERSFDLTQLNPGDPGYGLVGKEILIFDTQSIKKLDIDYTIVFRGCNIGTLFNVRNETTASINVQGTSFIQEFSNPNNYNTVVLGTTSFNWASTGVLNALNGLYTPAGYVTLPNSSDALVFTSTPIGLTSFSSGSYVSIFLNYRASNYA